MASCSDREVGEITEVRHEFHLAAEYLPGEGTQSKSFGFVPTFRLRGKTIQTSSGEFQIKALPNDFSFADAAYAFLFFDGRADNILDRELTLLIEDYVGEQSRVLLDSNANLDFTDDGDSIVFAKEHMFALENSSVAAGKFFLRVFRSNSEIPAFVEKMMAKGNPGAEILESQYWFRDQRHEVRVSEDDLNGKPIRIFLVDGSVDGLYTETEWDKIQVVEAGTDADKDLLENLPYALPINNQAVFSLYGKNYQLHRLDNVGNHLVLADTDLPAKQFARVGTDVSDFKLNMEKGGATKISALLELGKPLIIDVGGTWCAGCLTQEPIVKLAYASGNLTIVNLFEGDTPETVAEYVKEHQLEWPVGYTTEQFTNYFRVQKYPTYILVDAQGITQNLDLSLEALANFANH